MFKIYIVLLFTFYVSVLVLISDLPLTVFLNMSIYLFLWFYFLVYVGYVVDKYFMDFIVFLYDILKRK